MTERKFWGELLFTVPPGLLAWVVQGLLNGLLSCAAIRICLLLSAVCSLCQCSSPGPGSQSVVGAQDAVAADAAGLQSVGDTAAQDGDAADMQTDAPPGADLGSGGLDAKAQGDCGLYSGQVGAELYNAAATHNYHYFGGQSNSLVAANPTNYPYYSALKQWPFLVRRNTLTGQEEALSPASQLNGGVDMIVPGGAGVFLFLYVGKSTDGTQPDRYLAYLPDDTTVIQWKTPWPVDTFPRAITQMEWGFLGMPDGAALPVHKSCPFPDTDPLCPKAKLVKFGLNGKELWTTTLTVPGTIRAMSFDGQKTILLATGDYRFHIFDPDPSSVDRNIVEISATTGAVLSTYPVASTDIASFVKCTDDVYFIGVKQGSWPTQLSWQSLTQFKAGTPPKVSDSGIWAGSYVGVWSQVEYWYLRPECDGQVMKWVEYKSKSIVQLSVKTGQVAWSEWPEQLQAAKAVPGCRWGFGPIIGNRVLYTNNVNTQQKCGFLPQYGAMDLWWHLDCASAGSCVDSDIELCQAPFKPCNAYTCADGACVKSTVKVGTCQ